MNSPFKASKTRIAYNVHLKDTLEVFTKRLFYGLFDTVEQQQKESVFVEQTFLEIASTLSIDNGKKYGQPLKKSCIV